MKNMGTVFIAVSFIFYCCNSSLKTHSGVKVSCAKDSLLASIKDSWKYNTHGYYMTNDSFIAHLSTRFHDCIYQMDTAKIIKYFGRHFKTGQEKYIYNDTMYSFLRYELSPPPTEEHRRYSILYFYFDKKNKVKQVYVEVIVMAPAQF